LLTEQVSVRPTRRVPDMRTVAAAFVGAHVGAGSAMNAR
jgi:hypothetical protein